MREPRESQRSERACLLRFWETQRGSRRSFSIWAIRFGRHDRARAARLTVWFFSGISTSENTASTKVEKDNAGALSSRRFAEKREAPGLNQGAKASRGCGLSCTAARLAASQPPPRALTRSTEVTRR